MLTDPEMPVRTTRDGSGSLSSLYGDLEHIIVTHPDRKDSFRKVHNLDDYIKEFNISLMALEDKIAAKKLLMHNLCKVFVRHFPRQLLLGENAEPYRQRLIKSLTEQDRIAKIYKGSTMTLAESAPAEDPALAAAKFLADPARLRTNALNRRIHALKAHQKYWTRSAPKNEEGGGGGSTNKGGRRRNRRTHKN